MTTDKPELLAPAGDWEALKSAVANGADAVYFGLADFNARHRATNFTLAELPEVIRYLHDRNVRGYVTCNTLIFSEELPELVTYISALATAGVDAVIVQDLGLVRLIKRLAPQLVVHASTQMTLADVRGVEFVRELGIERAILARELSRKDIAAIRAGSPLPVEVFVHGALCVAYSGQCLTSESLGGRSANRGQCAQACRLPYDLIVDGEHRDLGDQAYLLSPQDLAAPDLIDDLVQLGVSCFKIEGRLKSAQYVAATTQTYRAALDAALSQQAFELTPEQRLTLTQSFSRGFTHGFLDGIDHQELVHGRFPKSRGVKVGTVAGKTREGLLVELEAELHSLWEQQPDKSALKPGDGVVIDEGHPEQDEQGGRVIQVSRQRGRKVEIVFHGGDVNLAAVTTGSLIWKTDDPAFRKQMERSYARDVLQRRTPIRAVVKVAVGHPLQLTFRTFTGQEVTVASESPLAAAIKHSLTHQLLRDQLERLGDTPFQLTELELWEGDQLVPPDTPVPVMVPKSLLNDLRRRAAELLWNERRLATGNQPLNPSALEELRTDIRARWPAPANSAPAAPADTNLNVLVRSLPQLEAVLAWQANATGTSIASVTCDFEDPKRYVPAVALCRSAGMPIALATLRVVKPHEDGWLRQIGQAAPDAVLIRNVSAWSFYRQNFPHLTLWGDYSLNVSNELTAALFAERGIERIVPSYDLNWQQLAALLKRFDPRLMEVVIHQHMPMFHMEHCVFCHTLSTGTDHRDCGRPCDVYQVDLQDRVGERHPLVADIGCRNTVFNAHAQSAAEYVPRLKELGVRHYRVELLRETAADIDALLTRYTRVLAGLEEPRQTWRQLQVLNQLGVTRGPLDFE